VVGGLLFGDDRLALCMVFWMMHDSDDASATVHRLSIARLVDRMGVVLRMTAVVRDYAVQRSVMRMTRRRRGEISLNGRGCRHLSILQIREILFLILMNLEGGEKFRIVVARGETKMRSVIATDDSIIIATVF